MPPDPRQRAALDRAVIDHAFTELRLKQLVVAVATDNLRAQKIPLRLGFKQVSTLKKAEWLYDHHVDHFVYSLAKAGE